DGGAARRLPPPYDVPLVGAALRSPSIALVVASGGELARTVDGRHFEPVAVPAGVTPVDVYVDGEGFLVATLSGAWLAVGATGPATTLDVARAAPDRTISADLAARIDERVQAEQPWRFAFSLPGPHGGFARRADDDGSFVLWRPDAPSTIVALPRR